MSNNTPEQPIKKIRVKLSTRFPDWSFIQQTPSSSGIWNNCEFHIDDDTKECDWWVVFGGLTKEQTALCYAKNVILITDEPSQIKKYDPDFIKQFHTVITVQKSIVAPHIINEQLLPWYVGAHFDAKSKSFDRFDKSYDELKSVIELQKTKLISVISSDKKGSEGQRQRLKFIKRLKKHFGDRLDVFGSGINTVEDKWDAISPYKYHIVLENSVEKNYWTEKLADAYLGQAYPIYHGCQNINDYFPADSLSCIDISKPDEAIETIDKVICEDFFGKSKENISQAKKKILDQYQMFPRLCEIINNLEREKGVLSTEKIQITLIPETIIGDTFLKKWIGRGGIFLKRSFPSIYTELKKIL